MSEQLHNAMEGVARKYLRIPELPRQKLENDQVNVSLWDLKVALQAAHQKGYMAHERGLHYDRSNEKLNKQHEPEGQII